MGASILLEVAFIVFGEYRDLSELELLTERVG